MSESPNAFMPKASAVKMSRRPFYIGGFLACLLLIVFLYGFFNQKQQEAGPGEPLVVENKNDGKPLLPVEDQHGLSLPEEAQPEAAPAPGGQTPQIVVVTGPREDETVRREREQLRRHNLQAEISALGSPLLVKRNPTGSGQTSGSAPDQASLSQRRQAAESSSSYYGGENGYDVEADKDKEGFLSRANALDSDWVSRHKRRPGQPLELKTGTVIPGLMITGINSDLPGVMIAQVRQNVYDSASGRYLLIPQGAKLYGVYDSRVIYGQERVLIAWNRLLFPDGSALTLGAMPGADMSGYSGFSDQVNHHYAKIFGSAGLLSVILGGTAYTMDSLGSGNSEETTMHGEMVSALASTFGQATMQILQKNLNIKPTLEIRPGYAFNVMVIQDLVFDAPYTEN